ncbi:MAG: chromosome segregation protein SMC [Candidatus Hydrogenedentes bacterium]|nr:chromosome segregation protein SMC [Candidatus Hydrogenedentota bacterium]
MYFKQVELMGFKSFADRTQVNLEPGITAIVGPNGCGKSNILDALRWSLGEQSAKALRGNHMQDVIFNGSEHRSAMGMAEVTLVFDNADSRLPIDFAEVQVTRRVYRSGESEYLINKAPCRLRDIQEMFMDTGIGTNAYSLIGQGKIDMVLSSKPDDRRYLFEEAAGIIKYKSRKRIAIRKLEQAEQNLLRLSDIINEVQRQMRSLKRQVNAAIRHRELTTLLRELEIRNAWLHYNELSGQIEDLTERFANARDAYEKYSAETSTLEAKGEGLNAKRIEIERMLMARRDGEYQVDSEMERLENQIALLRKEVDFAKTQQAQADKEREEFLAKAESTRQNEGEQSGQASGITGEIQAAQAALETEHQQVQEAEEAVKAADAEVDRLRNTAIEVLNSRNKTETELETVGVSIGNIDQQLEAIYARQKDQHARNEQLTTLMQQAQQRETEKRTVQDKTVEERKQAQQTRQQQSERLEVLNKQWQELREKKSSQEARLKSLRELRDSYEGFATGVRAIMKAKQNDIPGVQGIIGPVGDLISTEKQYGRAVEAALGGNINNIVVEEADAAKSAINFLKQHQAGRVTFLPLDTIRASNRDDSDTLRGQPGVVGNAIDYVQCEGRVLPAVQYLLFNTMIVQTIDDAIRIARSERRYPRLVTLDGEVVSSSGAVTGGRTKNESTGLLGRSAEIEELEKQVAYAEKKIAQMASEGASLTNALQELNQRIKALDDTETTLRAELNDVGVALAKFSTELESVTQSSSQLTQQRDALLAQRTSLESRRETAQERISTFADDDTSLQQRMTEAQEASFRARQRHSECGDRLADIRVNLASLTRSLEEAERNKLRIQQEYQEAVKEAERRLKLIDDLKYKERDVESGIADALERVKALSETKEEAHAKVLESQQEQDKLNKSLQETQDRLKTLRTQTQEKQKEVHGLELDLTHKEERISFFQERILTEYSLALASLTEKDVGTDEYDEKEREKLINEHRKDLQRLGTVNLMAIEEYESLEKREEFLRTQDDDLRRARETLLSVVDRIDATIKTLFLDTFKMVGDCFKDYFRRLFNGGQARIYLLDESDPLESGIEIEARPPGKKPQTISLLSGGEQAMTAIALLFSIFRAKPSPFCVLDEVDAPLDDANIGRFLKLVEEFTDRSQFIIITHNKQTMASADALFGVTQQERGVSQLVSVKFDEMKDAETAA